MTDYIKRDIERIIANAQECDIDALTWEEQKERLKAVKSVDVAPVRHGRWIETSYDEFQCSVCKKVVREEILYAIKPSDREDASMHIANYCPNCGAKMDEEEKHGQK